jgi:hypothetical protein
MFDCKAKSTSAPANGCGLMENITTLSPQADWVWDWAGNAGANNNPKMMQRLTMDSWIPHRIAAPMDVTSTLPSG